MITLDIAEMFSKIPEEELEKFRNRFWIRVKKTKSCWIWLGHIDRYGYGKIHSPRAERAKAKLLLAHRASLFMSGKTMTCGMVVDHICRNRSCVRPEHLRLVSPGSNVLENSNSIQSLNKRKEECLNGHLFTKENTLISKRGQRGCRSCQKIRIKKYSRNRSLSVL